jgi:thioredoxin reductase (NADPH)
MADWDVVVIGGGAAGLSAAAVVAGAGLRCLLLDPMGGGGELMNLGALHDVPGHEGSNGPDLAAQLLEAAMTAGVELGFGAVTALAGPPWQVTTVEESHAARAVILATGLAPGTLGLANEEKFLGQGLSHCAACDGPLYRGQPVVVAGADRWAVQEAAELAETCAAVTLVTQGAPAPEVPGVTVIEGRVTALHGEGGLQAVLVGTHTLPARAIFVQCGRRPALGFAASLPRDAEGHLPFNPAPRLFAAGGIRAGGPALLAAVMADGVAAGRAAAKALGSAVK